jgi:uncharacterized protein
MYSLIENNLNEIVALCKKHNVKSISLFGSAAKNTMNHKSDIDFLVNFSEDINLLDYADNYFSFLDALKQILDKEIDLITEKSIKNPILKEEIFRTKIDLYAA